MHGLKKQMTKRRTKAARSSKYYGFLKSEAKAAKWLAENHFNTFLPVCPLCKSKISSPLKEPTKKES